MIHYRRTESPMGQVFTAWCGEKFDHDDPWSTDLLDDVDCKWCLRVLDKLQVDAAFAEAKFRAFRGLSNGETLKKEVSEVIAIDRRRQKRQSQETDRGKPPVDHSYVGMCGDYGGIDDSVFAEAEKYATRWNSIDCDEWTHEQQLRGKDPDWSSLWVLQMNIKDGMWDP